jgi:hypothetical protein
VKKLNRLLRQGIATEQTIKKAIADDPDVTPEKRRSIDVLFQSFLPEWKAIHAEKRKRTTAAAESPF